MKIPLVSAVVTLHRSSQFLVDALRSVFEQSYPMLDIVVVDDGSAADIATTVHEMSKRYHRSIRVAKPKTRSGEATRPTSNGRGANWNLGAKRSRGELLAFLEADDVWLPTKIDEQVAVLERHPEVAMVYGRTEFWQSWQQDQDQREDFFYDLGIVPERVYAPPALLNGMVASQGSTPIISNAMIRRDAFQKVGGFDEDFRGWFEEQIFFAKLYLQSSTYVANANWARHRTYRGRSDLGPHFALSTYYRRRRPLLEWLRDYLPQTEYAHDPVLQNLLMSELSASRHPYWSALKRQTSRIRVRRDSVG